MVGDKTLDFIIGNINSMMLIILFIGALFCLYKTGRNILVKKILKELIVKAEKYYNSGAGVRKKAFVIKEFYRRTKVLKVFLSEKELDNIIEILVVQMKNQLE